MRSLVGTLSILVVIFITMSFSGGCCPKKKVATAAPPPPAPAAQAPVVKEAPPPPPPVVEKMTFEPIYFDFDKSNLKPPAIAKLDKIGDWMSKDSTARITIEGNCDERGTNEYNFALGDRRANSAKQYLVNLGISADRLSTISYGEERPADPGHDEAAWAKNRRDEFKLME